MEHYVPVLIFSAVAVSIPVVAFALSALLQPKKGRTDTTPYECGIQPTTAARERYSVQYYVIAVLFVVFDVETIFLFPWAVKYDQLALFGFIEMAVFILILVVGYAYAWKKGALEWVS
jgi:NADH-quinone oxidoreductase subunit A